MFRDSIPTNVNNSNVQLPSSSSSSSSGNFQSINPDVNQALPGESSESESQRSENVDNDNSTGNYRENVNRRMEFSEINLSIQTPENRNNTLNNEQEDQASLNFDDSQPRVKRRCIEHPYCSQRTLSWNSKKNSPSVSNSRNGEKFSISKESSCWEKFTKPSTLENEKQLNVNVPKAGTPVTINTIKKAGQYLLGPLIGTSPVKSIVQCLARRVGTDKFYTIKILTLKDDSDHETQDDRQGKMLLHAEFSLLSLLQNQDGVVHHHGFFKDCAMEEKKTATGNIYTGKLKRRLCLVLDCLTSHDFNPRNEELLNLQHHVIREKKLSEKETLLIFYDTVRIVACLHKRNIVHRDLKLGNLVINRKTRKVTITNFCLGKHLASENDLLKDQRGSPAYISPDVLCGKPYLGKPSDMWALGVVLFTMLFGQFPFYDSSPTQLFSKIKAANYNIPNDGRVSEGTISLIRNLLVLQPSKRLTALQVLDSLDTIIATFRAPIVVDEEDQVVPEMTESTEETEEKKEEKKETDKKSLSDFFKHITLQEKMHQMMKQPSPILSRPKPYGQIPLYRIESDARELTQAELNKYKHLIPRDNQRQHNSNRRIGFPIPGTRSRSSQNQTTNQEQRRDSNNQQIGTNDTNPATSNLTTNQSPNSQSSLNLLNSLIRPLVTNSVSGLRTRQESHSSNTSTSLTRPTGDPINRTQLMRQRLSLNHSSDMSSRSRLMSQTSTLSSNSSSLPENLNRNTHSTEESNRPRHGRIQADMRNSESRVRQSNSRSLSASSVSALTNNSTSNHTTSNSDEILRDINRSVPDLRNRSQQVSFREAIVDRIINSSLRMHQRQINIIERRLAFQRRISSAASSQSNSNPRDFLLSRRASSLNRHSPYVIQSMNNLRRSDSSSSRSIDSIVGYARDVNTSDSRVLRLCPVRNDQSRNNSMSVDNPTNIINNHEQLVQNQSSLPARNSNVFRPVNSNPTQQSFNHTNSQNDNVFNFLSRLNSNFPSNDTSSNNSTS